jgi:uncharacterized membrane protein YidH (DUF202 family)
VSLAFLSGALSSELFVLILIEHRVWGSVDKPGLTKYLKTRRKKKQWFMAYSILISITYCILMITNAHYNHKNYADNPEKTKAQRIEEVRRSLFLESAGISVIMSYPLIAGAYAYFTRKMKQQMVFEKYTKQKIALMCICGIIVISTFLVTARFFVEMFLQEELTDMLAD